MRMISWKSSQLKSADLHFCATLAKCLISAVSMQDFETLLTNSWSSQVRKVLKSSKNLIYHKEAGYDVMPMAEDQYLCFAEPANL